MRQQNDQTVKWYVVHTYSGYEKKVAQNLETIVQNRHLEDFIQAIKIPVETVEEIKDGVKKESERKLFPSYVLVKMVMTDDTWYIVRNVRGVTGFVGPGSKPIALTKSEVEAMGVDERRVKVDYEIGDSVKVVEGSLKGFMGTVESLDTKNNKVSIKVSMLGRQMQVELELEQVAPME